MISLTDSFACHLCGDPQLKSLQICASVKHGKKTKADPLADSSKAFSVNREVSIVDVRRFIFLELMPVA